MEYSAVRAILVNTPLYDPSAPENGDLVVARETRSPTRHTLRQHPGAVQLSTADREEAIRLARGFGAAHRLAVWYRDEDGYRVIESFRGDTVGDSR